MSTSMIDVAEYLRRIGVEGGVPSPTLESLRALHKRHLMSVPYDNGGAADRLPPNRGLAEIPLPRVFAHVVTGRNGGVCYELNRLFHALLTALGYEVLMVAAAIRLADDRFGPDEEHSFNLVRLDGRTWLVDVGFVGPSYLEPLELSAVEQEQYGCAYRVVERGDAHVVERRPRDGAWQAVYRFRPGRADRDGWEAVRLDGLDDYARDSVLAGTTFRGRAAENGQHVLIGRRYFTVLDGVETTRVLVKKDEFARVTESIMIGG
ncbi:arylamine N-acetyltransferase [Actinosynnema pretiosum subsp. pretiosum]|nr:arylamine N-acetyltransferase [Actinosynnema mirum]QUF05215.1 arylamine N-acetyltransferase [Actinosynnema pretiosum subsp. pretiosum]